jgi:hypothetical protein
MLNDYFALGPQEIWNTARLQAYLRNVGSPFTTGGDICGCDTLGRTQLEEDPASPLYDTPATDVAPWYDADLPESGEFLGFLPLSVSGLNDNPRARNITNSVGGGGVFGPARALPLTVTVRGLLIGTSCCGVDYGMYYLSEALAGCGEGCDGDCAVMYNCCPETVMTKPQVDARHKRTYRRVALVSGPTEVERTGTGGTCARGQCGANGDIVEVEFVIAVASPWPWTETTELLNVTLPIGGTGNCIEWCLSSSTDPAEVCGQGECAHAPCSSAANLCADPTKPVPAPPTATVPEASFCIPIASERACYTIDLSTRPQWSNDVPMITITAGSSELRNLRITIHERPQGTTQTCEQIADANRCDPLNDVIITYIPAGGAVTVDGQTGRATLECGGECRNASTVFGDEDGGPLRIREMSCAEFCLCIESDPNFPPAADARLTFGVSGRTW